MKLIKYIYCQSPKLLFLAVVTGVLGGLSGTALIALITEVISKSGSHSPESAWIFFGLLLAHLFTKTCSEMALLHSSQSAIVQLRVVLSRNLLATPINKLQEIGKHGLLAVITKDVETMAQAFFLAPFVFGNIVIIVGCLCYMAWLSWEIVAIYTICLIFGIALFLFAERGPAKLLIKVREQTDLLYQNFRNLIEGTRELQLNAQRGTLFVERVISPSALRFRHLFIRSSTGYITISNIGGISFYFVIGILVFVVPIWMPQSVIALGTMTIILLYLIGPIIGLVNAIPALRQANIALGRIEQLGGDMGGDKPQTCVINPFTTPNPLRLELRGIHHEYPGDTDDRHFTLGPVNLTLNQGEVIFIVGGNGSGKTTLAMLMLGFYPPEAGEILFNGIKVTDENRVAYQQQFSAVFSDFHLFEELLDADENQLSARAAHYIDRLAMSHKVKVEGNRFSTIDLSGGQRKRLALVSAYLEDRPVYVLDEWAADQDPTFKRVFYLELLPELKAQGKTVIVITHDEPYFNCADQIVKIQDGQLKRVVNRLHNY